jgi:hypothetical protein
MMHDHLPDIALKVKQVGGKNLGSQHPAFGDGKKLLGARNPGKIL